MTQHYAGYDRPGDVVVTTEAIYPVAIIKLPTRMPEALFNAEIAG